MENFRLQARKQRLADLQSALRHTITGISGTPRVAWAIWEVLCGARQYRLP
jgi:hypothetical protein